MTVKNGFIEFEKDFAVFPLNTETEKAARRACMILAERDLTPMWESELIRKLTQFGYSKSTSYRAVQWLADNGVLHILRDQWGNAVSCNMFQVYMRDFWLSFVIPF